MIMKAYILALKLCINRKKKRKETSDRAASLKSLHLGARVRARYLSARGDTSEMKSTRNTIFIQS